MIKIIDSFFEEKLFKNVKNHITTRLIFTPRYFTDSIEKSEENYYGSRYLLSNDKQLKNTFVTQAEKKFKFKIKNIDFDSGVDIRNYNNFKPHVDDRSKLNILIMVAGPTAVTNGTVFYYGPEENCDLDIHVGFRENRAILFPSNWVHSAHKSNVKNLKRYTVSLFVNDYEE